MAVFDVREDVKEGVIEIVFAEMEVDGTSVAYKLTGDRYSEVAIWDKLDEYVLVKSAQDAQNLIKALNKAIELGWLK